RRGDYDSDGSNNQVPKGLVAERLCARPQFTRIDQLRGTEILQRHAPADPFVRCGRLFDDVSGERQVEQFAGWYPAAPLEHAEHNAGRLGGGDHGAKVLDGAEKFAGIRGSRAAAIRQVADHVESLFRMLLDVYRDIAEERTITDEQQVFASHHL